MEREDANRIRDPWRLSSLSLDLSTSDKVGKG